MGVSLHTMSSFKPRKVYRRNGCELVLEVIFPQWRRLIRFSQYKVISLLKVQKGAWDPYPCYRYKHAIMGMQRDRKTYGRDMMKFQGMIEP